MRRCLRKVCIYSDSEHIRLVCGNRLTIASGFVNKGFYEK